MHRKQGSWCPLPRCQLLQRAIKTSVSQADWGEIAQKIGMKIALNDTKEIEMVSTGCKRDAGQSERERATFGEVWIEERFSVEKTFE